MNELEKFTPLIKKAVSFYNPKDHHEFEELYSLALEGAWEAIKNFDRSKSNLKTYMINMINWKILDSFRKKRIKTSQDNYNRHSFVEDHTIKDFMQTLSKYEQQILKYRLEGYTYLEIRDLTGKSITKLQSIIYKIQEKYRIYEKN